MQKITGGAPVAHATMRLGAIALAAGGSALWATTAHAFPSSLITQTFDINFNPGGDVTIGTGSPFGFPQYTLSQTFEGPLVGDFIVANGSAGVVGTVVCEGSCKPKSTTLHPGDTIGPASSFLTSSDGSIKVDLSIKAPDFTGYLGLQFDIDGAPDPYGYAKFVNDTLVSVTYDTSGNPITIPSVPEPASLSLLALGAVGLAALRRRRANA